MPLPPSDAVLSLFDDDGDPDLPLGQSVPNHPDDCAVVELGEPWTVQPTDPTHIEIRRSARRKRSVSAYREHGKTVVLVPSQMKQSDVDVYVAELVGRLDFREMRSASTEALMARARRLVAQYLDWDIISTHKVPVKISWVRNQNTLWGSCTASDGTIRLSHRLYTMPDYVIDSVLFHELIHLVVANHGPRFQELMNRYDQLEKANAFLDGVTHARQYGDSQDN